MQETKKSNNIVKYIVEIIFGAFLLGFDRREREKSCLIAYMFRVLCTYFKLIFLDLKRSVRRFSVSIFITFIHTISVDHSVSLC